MFLVVLTLAFGGAACARPDVPSAPIDNSQLVLGEQVWSTSCVSCHGSQGQGGLGTKLNEGSVVAKFTSFEAEVKVVAEGTGAMPRFNSKLTPEQIDAVVAYTRDVL
jgi:mono/diheme cytochrome c family protein